jgi:hypothetical protein
MNSIPIIYLIIIYIAKCFLLLLIVIFIYVAYSYNRSFFTVNWPVTYLSYLLNFTTKVLYMPFIGLFLSIFVCSDNVTKGLINDYNNDISCFKGTHFVFIFTSIIFTIQFTLFSFMTGSIYFERFDDNKDKTARYSSLDQVFMILNKFFIVAFFTFMNTVIFYII